MVRFHAKINSQGQVYFPEEIRAELNTKELELLGNARSIVIYPKGTHPSEVLRSLKVVIEELKHRCDLEQAISDEARKILSAKKRTHTLRD
jgi:bifunctional DNA-binding transcriptional regulator/antitoxin component of YhaV-PrlF toxin-antitoxin module